MKAWLWLVCFCQFCATLSARPYLQPDPHTHRAFLLYPYKQNKPSLVIFKDPRCPYCISGFKALEALEQFNLYLFWAPILGQDSENLVKKFFRCASPVDKRIINAVSRRDAAFDCSMAFQSTLFELNTEMLKSYRPSTVPQYWLSGRPVNLLQLRQSPPLQRLVSQSPVRVPWHRYQAFIVHDNHQSLNAAVVLADPRLKSDLANLLLAKTDLNWFIFYHNDPDPLAVEFISLLGLSQQTPITFLVEGQQIDGEQLLTLLSSHSIKPRQGVK